MTDVRELALATDTQIAELQVLGQRHKRDAESAFATLRRAVGDTLTYTRTGSEWTMTTDEVWAAVESSTDDRVAALELAHHEHVVSAESVYDEIDSLNRVWADNGYWSRFYLVTNTNGHIHSTTGCTTCYPTTEFAWLPGLSGLTEADAVADQGEILCSVCFPTAPSEWTDGESKATKEARAEREAKKAEREAKKVAKALYPEDPDKAFVTAGRFGDRIKTIHAAKAWLTDAAMWETIYAERGEAGTHHPSYPVDARDALAEVLGDRLGTDAATEIAAAAKRAAKRK